MAVLIRHTSTMIRTLHACRLWLILASVLAPRKGWILVGECNTGITIHVVCLWTCAHSLCDLVVGSLMSCSTSVEQSLLRHSARSEERRVGKECRSRWWT